MKSSQLRIIGGKWRGRKIDFLPLPGLRPTTDFVRETLFNWLSPYIQGANCLDLFAGSGALGFEALSRGAQHVVMVDAVATTVARLRHNCEKLGTTAVDVYLASMPEQWGKIAAQKFDLVFLDPPFNQQLLLPMIKNLEDSACFGPSAFIYLECEHSLDLVPALPSNWRIFRQKIGQVAKIYLCKREIC